MTRRKEHIVLAIPSLRGSCPLALADWVARLTANNANDDVPFGFSLLTVQFKSPFEYARNVAVGEFLQTDGDRLWFVDDDMIPYPGRSELLLQSDADIVVGGYIRAGAKKDFTIGLDVLLMEEAQKPNGEATYKSLPYRDEKEFFDVAAGGTGCMLIRRRVLEDPRMLLPTRYVDWRGIERDLFDAPGDSLVAPPVFRTLRKPNGDTDLGEDIDFCRRARALGYTLRGHMLYGMDHQKTTTAEMLLRTIAREKVLTRESTEGVGV